MPIYIDNNVTPVVNFTPTLTNFKVSTTLTKMEESVVWMIYFEEISENGYLLGYQQTYWMKNYQNNK